jgi:hypothetical protein
MLRVRWKLSCRCYLLLCSGAPELAAVTSCICSQSEPFRQVVNVWRGVLSAPPRPYHSTSNRVPSFFWFGWYVFFTLLPLNCELVHLHSRLQLCSCLVVLGVFFAINAEVGVSNSSYTISVVASVVVFVVFLLTACFCAPLTFSTEFEADAVRKVITFHASVLGCISWRSMCSACKFQDVQVKTCTALHIHSNFSSARAM